MAIRSPRHRARNANREKKAEDHTAAYRRACGLPPSAAAGNPAPQSLRVDELSVCFRQANGEGGKRSRRESNARPLECHAAAGVYG